MRQVIYDNTTDLAAIPYVATARPGDRRCPATNGTGLVCTLPEHYGTLHIACGEYEVLAIWGGYDDNGKDGS